MIINCHQLMHYSSKDLGLLSGVLRRCAILTICILLLSALFQPLVTQAEELTVDSQDQQEISRIKSAYLYNFLKYVQFNEPDKLSNLEQYSVCVLGDDPFGSALDAMSGRIAKGASVKVHRITNVAKAKTCHIVYVSKSEQTHLTSIFNSLKDLSILTVSDIKDFAKLGGVIGFTGEHKKIGIEINLTNARQSNIQISALLLEIARIID